MERPISRRYNVRNRNNTLSTGKRSSEHTYKRDPKQNLTPLQRLKKFKRIQESRSSKVNPRKLSKHKKKVTFAEDMATEAINGSHETDLGTDEKILKPRKSILSNNQDDSALQNGNNENESISENENIENGHDLEVQNGEVSKPNKRTPRQKNVSEKRESTPTRQSLYREAKTVKESTPKPETPSKRELRHRETTPRKTSPKREASSKHDSKSKGTSSRVNSAENNNEPNLPKPKVSEDANGEQAEEKNDLPDTHGTVGRDNETSLRAEESVIVIEESTNNEKTVMSITEIEDEVVVSEAPQEKSFFSAFRSIKRKTSVERKDACEASSSSIICLDSPSINEEKIVPTKDIKGRKPINSFSRFPGRNVSISSIDKSLKRKAEESFEDEERKRFAGETVSGSEKSPGWHFFSPRVWSPRLSSKPQAQVPTSTPLHGKPEDQDSMAVNYDSQTRLDLDDTVESDTLSSKQRANNKWCTIM